MNRNAPFDPAPVDIAATVSDPAAEVATGPGAAGAGDAVGKGIVFIVLATLFFGVMDASIKWLSETYPVPQVTFFRAIFGLVPFLPVVLRTGGGALRLRRPGPVLLRSLLAPAAMLCIFGSFSLLPLAEATTIAFGAPILMAALAVPLLGERVGWRRWTAILFGFAGVLVAARPDGVVLSVGATLAIGGMALYSLMMVWGRLLTRTDSATGLSFYAMLASTVVMAFTLPWFWVTPTWADLGLMAMMGMSGGVAVYFLTRAFQLAPVAVLSPLDYLNLPVATFTGWLIWQELPGEHVLWGAMIIIGSGLFIVYRENRVRRV